MTEKIKQILEVYLETKREVCRRADLQEPIADLDFDEIVNESCKKVANRLSKSNTTITDKLTRKLHTNLPNIKVAMKDYITGRNQDFKNLVLGSLSNMDDKALVERMLDAI